MKKKYLIVIADYYKDISKGLLNSALSLITKTPKKVVGLEGFNIKITKQELI